MERKGLEIALGLLTGAEASHFFFGRLPSRMTTRKFTNEEDKRQNQIALTESLIMGSVLALIIGSVMKSWIIPILAFSIMGLLALIYMNDIKGWW